MKESVILDKRIKEQLEKNKMSQRELAEKTGITEVTISRYVSAQRVPKATEIKKIADALNCSCDYLIGNKDKKNDKNTNEMLKTMMDALEKQIPKKPIRIDAWGEYYKCPICDKYAVDNLGCKYKFCRECGQKFDW